MTTSTPPEQAAGLFSLELLDRFIAARAILERQDPEAEVGRNVIDYTTHLGRVFRDAAAEVSVFYATTSTAPMTEGHLLTFALLDAAKQRDDEAVELTTIAEAAKAAGFKGFRR